MNKPQSLLPSPNATVDAHAESRTQHGREVEVAPLPVDVRFGGRRRSSWVARFAAMLLDRALTRFRSRIDSATVRVRDVNGRRGGVDQHCSLELRLADGQRLHVEDLAETPKAALQRIVRRARRLLREHRRR